MVGVKLDREKLVSLGNAHVVAFISPFVSKRVNNA
jgi:hypothetical protein